MGIKTLLAVCCGVYVVGTASAQELLLRDTEKSTTLMDERVSELLADRIKKETVLKELSGTIHELTMEEVLARESLMYPAEEPYGGHWENRNVNPFVNKKIVYPDSAHIDCSAFVIPIDGNVKITSKYGMRRRRMHRGIDLKVQTGDTIRAAFDGKIRIRSTERSGYGNYVVIRHTNGLETVYGHLSKFLVKEDDIVRAGEPIGLGGNTGRSTESHLHFETRFLGQDINPAEIIDFENGVPHKDLYVFRNVKVNGRNSNIYTSSDSRMVYHRIKSGDTLGAIARKYGTSVSELCRLNGLKSTSVLRIGQSIRINAGVETASTSASAKKENTTVKESTTSENKQQPGADATAEKDTKVTSGVDPSKVTVASNSPSSSKNVVTKATASAAPVNPGSEAPSPKSDSPVYYYNNQAGQEVIYHRIRQGDTLGAIAKRYGTTVKRLCELNGITETTILKLGRSLRCM